MSDFDDLEHEVSTIATQIDTIFRTAGPNPAELVPFEQAVAKALTPNGKAEARAQLEQARRQQRERTANRVGAALAVTKIAERAPALRAALEPFANPEAALELLACEVSAAVRTRIPEMTLTALEGIAGRALVGRELGVAHLAQRELQRRAEGRPGSEEAQAAQRLARDVAQAYPVPPTAKRAEEVLALLAIAELEAEVTMGEAHGRDMGVKKLELGHRLAERDRQRVAERDQHRGGDRSPAPAPEPLEQPEPPPAAA